MKTLLVTLAALVMLPLTAIAQYQEPIGYKMKCVQAETYAWDSYHSVTAWADDIEYIITGWESGLITPGNTRVVMLSAYVNFYYDQNNWFQVPNVGYTQCLVSMYVPTDGSVAQISWTSSIDYDGHTIEMSPWTVDTWTEIEWSFGIVSTETSLTYHEPINQWANRTLSADCEWVFTAVPVYAEPPVE